MPGGFTREVLVVVTTTGSGWVDPAGADSLDYLAGGDVATVAIQYSYLPSWLSYLVDQDRAREAGRELFDAVYDRWSDLSPDDRPRLYVLGESLGSFGGEAAFSGEYDLRNRISGAVFAGPPNFNDALPAVRRRPRPRQHRSAADLPQRPHRPLQHRHRRGRAPDRAFVGRLAGAVPASTRPIRSCGGTPTLC